MAFDFGSGVTAAIATFAKTGSYYAAAAAFVVGGLAGGDAKRSARNKARSAFNDAQRDRDQMVQSATAPHKIVYGRARVSGPIAYAQSTGSKGEFMHLVVLLAGHECDAIETVYFGDTALTLDGAGNVTTAGFARVTTAETTQTVAASGGATTVVTLASTPALAVLVATVQIDGEGTGSSPVAASLAGNVVTLTTTGIPAGTLITIAYTYQASSTPLVQITRYLGTATQTADAGLIAASGGKWTSAHRLRGLCYLYVRLEYDQDVFGATGLPDVSAVVRGRKVWSPLTVSTAWSDNAALCVADYLRSYMGATSTEVPDNELLFEELACEELVTVATGVTEKRYTCNGVLSTDQPPRDNLDALVEAMAGTVAWAQGRYAIRAGRHLSPEMTITEDMLAGGAITIQPAAQRTELINRVIAKYIEPAKAWTTIEAPPVTNATYVSDDGGLDLPSDVTLDMVTGAMRAQRLAKIMLERNRQGMRVQLTCNLRAYDVVPGSVVALTITRYGWSGKLFTVVERSHDFGAGTVALTLRETAAAVWDWAFGAATAVDLTPNTSLPNAYARPGALAGLVVVSGTSWLQRMGDGTIQCRARVSWAQTADVQVLRGGRIEVRHGRADGVTWAQAPAVAGDATSTVVGPLEEGYVAVFAVRAVTGVGVAGPWSYIAHTPVGKSAAPANVSGLAATVAPGAIQIAWNASAEADYAYTELRRGASWAAGVAMDGSAAASKPTRITGSSYLWAWPASGSYTVWAAHVDTSGNVSAAPASVAVTVDGSIMIGAGNFAGQIGGENLLANSSMEKQVAGIPWGFLQYNNAAISTTYTAPAGRTGGLAFGLRANAATTNTFGVLTGSGINPGGGITGGVRGGWQPGRTYVVSWWARGVAGGAGWTGGMRLEWNAAPASSTALLNPVLSSTWQRYAVRITWGASVETGGGVYINVIGSTASGDELHIDDVAVTEGDTLVAWSPSSADIDLASTTSTWSGVSGTGKPADNATVGAQAGVNLKDSGGTTLGDAAIKNTAITVNANGTLSGAGAGQVSLTSLPGSVATVQIAPGAATTVLTATASNVPVSNTGFTSLMTLSLGTAEVSGDVVITLSCVVSVTLVTGAADVSMFFRLTEAGIPISGQSGASGQFAVTDSRQLVLSNRFGLTAGSVAFVELMGRATGSGSNSYSISVAEMRAEIIKR
ncbi:MAG: hypothetical protein RLY71_419 [Pseudomonadota bacterium]|jgi:hypothetical protein